MGRFPRKKIKFVCDHDECQDVMDDGCSFDTLDELTEHQEETHSITYTEMEIWECSVCNEEHEEKEDAYQCCE